MLDSFDRFCEKCKAKKAIDEFVKRQLGSTRLPVRKRDEKILKKHKIVYSPNATSTVDVFHGLEAVDEILSVNDL